MKYLLDKGLHIWFRHRNGEEKQPNIVIPAVKTFNRA